MSQSSEQWERTVRDAGGDPHRDEFPSEPSLKELAAPEVESKVPDYVEPVRQPGAPDVVRQLAHLREIGEKLAVLQQYVGFRQAEVLSQLETGSDAVRNGLPLPVNPFHSVRASVIEQFGETVARDASAWNTAAWVAIRLLRDYEGRPWGDGSPEVFLAWVCDGYLDLVGEDCENVAYQVGKSAVPKEVMDPTDGECRMRVRRWLRNHNEWREHMRAYGYQLPEVSEAEVWAEFERAEQWPGATVPLGVGADRGPSYKLVKLSRYDGTARFSAAFVGKVAQRVAHEPGIVDTNRFEYSLEQFDDRVFAEGVVEVKHPKWGNAVPVEDIVLVAEGEVEDIPAVEAEGDLGEDNPVDIE